MIGLVLINGISLAILLPETERSTGGMVLMRGRFESSATRFSVSLLRSLYGPAIFTYPALKLPFVSSPSHVYLVYSTV